MRLALGTVIVLLGMNVACNAQDADYHDHDEYLVDCKEGNVGSAHRIFAVVIHEGTVKITDKESGKVLPAALYVNAIVFAEGSVEWRLDRFTSTLSSKPPGKVYGCTKLGGRRI